MKYIVVIALFLLISCNEKKHVDYIGLPEILENQIPSKDYELPSNIDLTKNDLPNKIKRIYQTQGQDTMNILEYDKQKNLIFKFYKQYEGDYWHDKFIFMVEANVYENNKLVKTYYLHSNVGYQLFLYEYDGNNISEVKNLQLNNVKGVNINQYSFIKKVKDYKSCIAFAEKFEIDRKAKLDYTIHREFGDNEIKEYSNDRTSYQLFNLNSKNQVVEIDYFAKGVKWPANTKYLKYDALGRIVKSYSMNRKDTLKSTDYKYDKSLTTVIRRENGFEKSREEYLNNKLIKSLYKQEGGRSYWNSFYELDQYGIPVKEIQKTNMKDALYSFKNTYEFY